MTDRQMDTRPRNAGIRYPPPLLFVLGLAAGWGLDRLWQLPLVSTYRGRMLAVLGLVLMGLGGLIGAWAMVTFASARTAILPHHTSTTVVDTGPYRFTRNPMYVAMTVGYVGGAFMLNSVWPLLLLPPVLAVLYLTVIRKEERYLALLFGEAYEDYRRRVRRWI